MDPGQSCDVSARPCEAGDHPSRNRIDGGHENDRDRLRGTLGRRNRRRTRREKYINFETDEPGRSTGKLVRTGRQPIFDADVLALDVPELAQPFPKAVDESSRRWTVAQKPDAIDPPRRLRFCGAWASQSRHRAV